MLHISKGHDDRFELRSEDRKMNKNDNVKKHLNYMKNMIIEVITEANLKKDKNKH